MTNGDKIRQCNNDQLVVLIKRLQENKFYTEDLYPRELDMCDISDISLWINKKTDVLDMRNVFNGFDLLNTR